MRGSPLVLWFACGVAPRAGKHGEDPAPSSVHLRLETGLRGWQAGVDAANRLWLEQGCKNGKPRMRRAASASDAQRTTVDRAVAGSPRDSPTLTEEQYLPVHAAMTAMFKIPHHECPTAPVPVHRADGGQAQTWAVKTCEVSP